MDCDIITNRHGAANIWNVLLWVTRAFLFLQLNHTCVCFLCRPNWQDFHRFSRGSEKEVGKSTNGSVQVSLVLPL